MKITYPVLSGLQDENLQKKWNDLFFADARSDADYLVEGDKFTSTWTVSSENGVAACPITGGSMWEPPVFTITNNGEDAVYHIAFGYQVGTMDNPDTLTVGSNTVSFDAGSMEDHTVVIEEPEQPEQNWEGGIVYTREQLANMITSEAVNETEVFRVMVTSPDPAHSAAIANAIVEALPAKIAAALPGSAMYVVDEAVEDYRQVSPDYRRMTALGFALGILLSGAAVVTMAVMDDSVRSEEYLQKTYAEIPLLTIIPDGGSYRSDTSTSYRQKGGR